MGGWAEKRMHMDAKQLSGLNPGVVHGRKKPMFL